MVTNIFLMLFVLGWAINCAVFQARRDTNNAILNGFLCVVFAVILAVRLTPTSAGVWW